jgi:hypothetical protein
MSEMKVIKNYPMDLSIELLFLRSIATTCDRSLWVDSVEKVGHGLRIGKVRVRD